MIARMAKWMEKSMTLETLIFVVGFPTLAPLVVSAILWRKLDRKWLFLVMSFLCIAAIADFSLSLFSDWLVPTIPNPLPADLLAFSVHLGHQSRLAMLLTDAVVVAIGIPLLAWLFAALRRTPSPIVSA